MNGDRAYAALGVLWFVLVAFAVVAVAVAIDYFIEAVDERSRRRRARQSARN